MKLSTESAKIAFEEFLKELPSDHVEMAYEFKAFSRGRKVKTPAHLLKVAMLYCGLDQALRTCAGSFTLQDERITDTSIHKRLRACGPWLKALLQAMLPSAGTALTSGRLLVVDATSLQGPGSEGTDYRVHLALDLVNLALHEMQATGAGGAESLARYAWQAGDIAMTDRGYNHPRVILELGECQVRVIVRLVPTSMPMHLRQEGDPFDPASERLNMAEYLMGEVGDTVTVPIWLRSGTLSGQGWVHAARLPPEAAEAARRRCRHAAKRQGWTPSRDALYLAGWVMVFTTIPPDELDCGAGLVPVPVASGTCVQKTQKPARTGRIAHPPEERPWGGLDTRKTAVCRCHRAAPAPSDGQGLEQDGPAPQGDPLALFEDCPGSSGCVDNRCPPLAQGKLAAVFRRGQRTPTAPRLANPSRPGGSING